MDWFGLSGAKGVVNCGMGLLQATVFLPCCAIRCDRVHTYIYIYTASAAVTPSPEPLGTKALSG